MAMDYFYDGQIRRYLLQFSAIFEGIQWCTGRKFNGQYEFRVVPIHLAMTNRQVAAIQKNNSENVMNTVPQLTVWLRDLDLDPERRQIPNGESEIQVYERDIDEQTGRYTGKLGKSYSVHRMMAVPYSATMVVDIWTSNEDQKQQILEQILLLFNPSIEIQTGTNPIDWTSLSTIDLTTIGWTSRTIPVGTSSDIDVTSLTFKMPIWLSPPAKLKRLNIIQQIVHNIVEKTQNGEFEVGYSEEPGGSNIPSIDPISRTVITPGDHSIEVNNNLISLRTFAGISHDENGDTLEWQKLLDLYGKLRPGISKLRLKTTSDIENFDDDIIGFLEWDITNPNNLIWTIQPETLPNNTLTEIDAIIDPHKIWPGNILPPADQGQRYLILDDLTGSRVGWGQLDVSSGDIIEFVNGKWEIVFDASQQPPTVQFLRNRRTNKQLKFIEGEWLMAVDGEYRPGYWRLEL